MIKILNIVGARPQFIKAAALHHVLSERPNIEEIIVHSGQHYDHNMSQVFFDELGIPSPHYNLNAGSGSHADQTGRILIDIEKVMIKEQPDWVVVYGDTNTTIAATLAASKLHIKTAHIEAGLRSYNRKMPEEINRIATDHISDILFAPTQNAANILSKEGLQDKTIITGDIMLDAVNYYSNKISSPSYKQFIKNDDYLLVTVHRQENTDNIENLTNIISALSKCNKEIIFPLHPRTKKSLTKLSLGKNINIIEPVGYFEILNLIKHSQKVITDSGGLQKEAFFLDKPCITLREETEWIETLNDGWNFTVGTTPDLILEKINLVPPKVKHEYFGKGNAARIIIDHLSS